MKVEAPLAERELVLPTALLKVHRFEWREPIDDVLLNDGRCYFDACLTPRPRHASGSYIGRFAPTHFEPMGELMFVPAGMPLHARASSGRQWALQCWFAEEAFADLPTDWSGQRLRDSLHVKSSSLSQVAARLVSELNEPGLAGDVVVASLCALITVDLVRHFTGADEADRQTRGGLPGWRLRRIEDRVRADGTLPTLKDLADLCAMSPRHLTRAFREQTGQSVGAYVEEIRLARARTLLATDDLSLKEIAGLLGFAQASAFSTAFRRGCGERPSAYRARQQAERRPVFLSRSHKPVP